MTNFILQPASGTEARRHYNDTVINQVDLSVIREFINEDEYQSLFGSFPFSSIATWGITRETHWEKIKLGDRLVFARDSHYFSTSIVTAKIKNSNLEKICGVLIIKGEYGNGCTSFCQLKISIFLML